MEQMKWVRFTMPQVREMQDLKSFGWLNKEIAQHMSLKLRRNIRLSAVIYWTKGIGKTQTYGAVPPAKHTRVGRIYSLVKSGHTSYQIEEITGIEYKRVQEQISRLRKRGLLEKRT